MAFLQKKITLFMVTHDPFLERVCTEIMELDQGLYQYKGNLVLLEKRGTNCPRGKFWERQKTF